MRSYRNEKASKLLLLQKKVQESPLSRLAGNRTDNGSELAWEFGIATATLGVQRYFSRVKTPKDNPEIERFNETLEYE